MVLVKVYSLNFGTSPEPLNAYIVSRSSFAIHRDGNAMILQCLGMCIARVLTARGFKKSVEGLTYKLLCVCHYFISTISKMTTLPILNSKRCLTLKQFVLILRHGCSQSLGLENSKVLTPVFFLFFIFG